MRVPWIARISNQSILKEINSIFIGRTGVEKLKLQYLGHLMQKADSLEKTLMLAKIEGKRKSGWQRMKWLNSITDSVDMNLKNSGRKSRAGESPVCCSPWGQKESDTT